MGTAFQFMWKSRFYVLLLYHSALTMMISYR